MRCLYLLMFFVLFVTLNCDCNKSHSSPFPSPPSPFQRQILSQGNYSSIEENLLHKYYQIKLNNCHIFQFFIMGTGLIFLLILSFLHLHNHVRYVTLSTNLSLYSGKKLLLDLLNAFGRTYHWFC